MFCHAHPACRAASFKWPQSGDLRSSVLHAGSRKEGKTFGLMTLMLR